MKPIVLVGHPHDCPLHGEGEVVTGSSTTWVNGRPIARVGDRTSCGAVIESGSAIQMDEGKPVARQGDVTSHEGVLLKGDDAWLVE
jgi:uncharacterized Zn-binding protein involved in type VI secretion